MPIQVASFFIMNGERVDFVLEANQPISSYWIRFKGHNDCSKSSIYQTAILQYKGSPVLYPPQNVTYNNSGPTMTGLTLNPPNTKIDSTNVNLFIGIDELRSANDKSTMEYLKKIRGKVTKRFYLGIDMNQIENTNVYTSHESFVHDAFPWTSAQINNITLQMPSSPLIYQDKKVPDDEFCNQQYRSPACSEDINKFCKCIHTIHVELNDLVEVIIVDGGSQSENHPFHLHGQSFAVLGLEKLGESIFMGDVKRLDRTSGLRRNLINPPLKDTVQVPSGGYLVFRFFAKNPGVWLVGLINDNY